MRKIVLVLGVLAFGAANAQEAQAQVFLGPTVAYHDDFDFGLGATLGAKMPALGERIGFMGDFLLFFPDADNLDYLEINANVTYDLNTGDPTFKPFAILGLNVARASVDVAGLEDSSNTEIGLNVGAGVTFDVGRMNPMVGLRLELSGGEGFVLFASLPFDVSGN